MRYLASSVVCCLVAFAQAPDVRPQEKCSMEGTVVNATTGEPVKRARLTLQPVGGPRTLPFATTTDSGGHFLIDEVDAGRYELTAIRSGYVTQSYSPHGNSKQSAAIALESGQKLKEIVFKLTPQGVITGRVLDEDGEPLDYVAVECMSVGYEHGKRHFVSQNRTNTNDLGEFRLTGLNAGKYVINATYQSQNPSGVVQERPVRAAAQGQAAKSGYATTYYPHTANANSASAISVTAGAQININVTLIRTRTVRIKGRVRMGDAALSRRMLVGLYPREDGQSGTPTTGFVDSEGRFEMSGIVAGSYMLNAMALADRKRYSAWMPIDVGDSDMEGIELTVHPPVELHGHLIVEEKGELKGAPLQLWLQSRALGEIAGESIAQVNDDLTFGFYDVQPVRYDIFARWLPDNLYLKAIRLGQQDVTETGVDFTEGVPAEELTVVVSANGGVIEGSVQNSREEPVSGVKVTLVPDTGHRPYSRYYKTADADLNGHFIIRGVAPGEYKIYAWEDIEDGAYQDPDFVKPHEFEGQTVNIKERGHETVQLKAIPAESAASGKSTQ